MTAPLNQPEEVRRFFAAYNPTEAELKQILKDAADEAYRLIPKLMEREGIGAKVRGAQLARVVREIGQQQTGMWSSITPVIRAGISRAVDQAIVGADSVIKGYLRKNGLRLPEFDAAFARQAKHGFQHIIAKGINNIPLSRRVYQTKAWAQGLVDRKVKAGLLLGLNAREIARNVRDLIRPDVPGGVSYAAMRLARTELNNAFHTTAKERLDEPWAESISWHLSGRHPKSPNPQKPEICEKLAKKRYKTDKVPPKPHPQCLCYITQDVVDEDTFLGKLLGGNYDGYLASKGIGKPESTSAKSGTHFRR